MAKLTARDRAHIGVRRVERKQPEFGKDDVVAYAPGDVGGRTVYAALDALTAAGELEAEHRGNRKVWTPVESTEKADNEQDAE
jgi:hypothetical protein